MHAVDGTLDDDDGTSIKNACSNLPQKAFLSTTTAAAAAGKRDKKRKCLEQQQQDTQFGLVGAKLDGEFCAKLSCSHDVARIIRRIPPSSVLLVYYSYFTTIPSS